MAKPVHFGLRVPQEVADPALLRRAAQTAERCGYQSLWVFDHFYHFPRPDNAAVLEAFTAMSLLAGWTETARIGSLVLCNGYRPPALTAKMAATLDVLSSGRLDLGYGAGWHGEEHAGYGYGFPPLPERIARMEEALAVIKLLWEGGPASFSGAHYQLREALCQPLPVQRPHPPITIGGGGERLLLRAVARHADVWNYFPVPLLEYERKIAALEEHCRNLGRDPASIRRSLLVPIITARREKEVRDQLEEATARGFIWARAGRFVQGTPDIVVPRLRDYVRRGVSMFILALPDPTNLEHIEFVAREVVEELA